MFYIIIDIDRNVKTLRIAIIKIILCQQLKSFQHFSVIANNATRLIGINLHIDCPTIMSTCNASFNIHFVHDVLHIARHTRNNFFNIIIFFHLNAQIFKISRLFSYRLDFRALFYSLVKRNNLVSCLFFLSDRFLKIYDVTIFQ